MNSKEKTFEWLFEQWKPLILKTLSQNYILGLERDDFLQELRLVLWECFAKDNIQHFPTYLSSALHNKVTDLYASSQRFYYPSLRLKCIGCGFVTLATLKVCPECSGRRWKETKGKLTVPLYEEIPHYDEEAEYYPEEIRELIEHIQTERKTGYKQKQKLRDYFKWVELVKV